MLQGTGISGHFILCLVITHCYAHVCVHNEVSKHVKLHHASRGVPKNSAATSLVPFTISPVVVVANFSTSSTAAESIDASLFTAVEFFSKALMVDRSDPDLRVPPLCLAVYGNGPAAERCAILQEELTCGPHVAIPKEHTGVAEVCQSNGECALEGPDGPGVPNADYILYVTAVQDSICFESPGTIAFASACFFGGEDIFRPIAGFVNFCPLNIGGFSGDVEFFNSVAIHEIFHAIGFSPNLFQFFVDGSGQFYQPFFSQIINGRFTTVLNSPEVLRVGREYFECESLSGVPMENEGGEGAASAHWESRVLYEEIMTAALTPGLGSRIAVSEFSLAVLADTGWYSVNLSATNDYQLLWGRGLGCSFPFTDCSTPSAFPYSCPALNFDGCTYDHQYIGRCRRPGFQDGCRIFIPLVGRECSEGSVCLTNGGITPVCVSHSCVRVTGTELMAYSITTEDVTDRWCFEGQRIGGVVCSPAELVCQRSIVTEVNDIPPPLCDSSCSTCDIPLDPAHCTSCDPGLTLNGTTCIALGDCTVGTFRNMTSNECQACLEGCAICTGLLNSECLRCVDEGQYRDTSGLLSSPCVEECTGETYPQTTAFGVRICKACPAPCINCSSSSHCLQCSEGSFLHEEECLESCPQGFEPQERECIAECPDNCGRCEQPGAMCAECESTHFLLGGTCVDVCPTTGYYLDGQECKPCSIQCRECTQAPTTCTRCASGYLKVAEGECAGECPTGSQPDFTSGECVESEPDSAMHSAPVGAAVLTLTGLLLYNI